MLLRRGSGQAAGSGQTATAYAALTGLDVIMMAYVTQPWQAGLGYDAPLVLKEKIAVCPIAFPADERSVARDDS